MSTPDEGRVDEGRVVVRGAASGFAQEVVIGRHRLTSDEPLSAGGTDTGPTHSRIHAVDCAECETKEGMLDRIDAVIELTGPLTEEQRARLLEIADRCPVHRTLKSEFDLRTRLAGVS
jgi:hypothetical protein